MAKFTVSAAIAAILSLAVPGWSACAAVPGDPVLGNVGPWGVVVHTHYHGDALSREGVQWVRIGLGWKQIEQASKGTYNWAETDRFVNYYDKMGFREMCIINAETINPLYVSDQANTETVIAAIASFAGEAAKRYRGKGIVWEIGNEPEVFPMGGYWNNPETYTKLARACAKAIRAADPGGHVAACSVAWMDRSFITRCLDAGLLADGTIDVVTYHGYHRANLSPESGLADDVQWLRTQVRDHAGAASVTVCDSERGYAILPDGTPKPSDDWRNEVYTESEQAAYLSRHYLESIHCLLPIIVWYKDMNGEKEFSLWYSDEKGSRGLRPSGNVYRNLSHLLPGAPSGEVNADYIVAVEGSDAGKAIVRTYMTPAASGKRKLVVAMWYPVEAFDGRILQERKREANKIVETWRPTTAADVVSLKVRVRISGKKISRIDGGLYDLLAPTTPSTLNAIPLTRAGKGALSEPLNIGPMPTVLVAEIE